MATHDIARATRVISLVSYRAAVEAARFLRGSYHEPQWLDAVEVAVEDNGEPVVTVRLNWETVLIRRCIPESVGVAGGTVRVVVTVRDRR